MRANRFFSFSAAAIVSVLATTPGVAQPVELKLGTFGPPSSFFIKEVIEPWIERVNRDSQGTLTIRHFGGAVLADQRQMYDAVRSNVAHIGWVTPSNTPSKFRKSSVFELPFGVHNSEQGSVVYWRLYEQGLLNDEFDEVLMLGAMVFPPGGIMTRTKKVATIEDLAGLKLRVTGTLQNDALKSLGATTVALPVDQMYQALDRGVIDGYASAFTAIRPFRLYEVTRYYTQVRLSAFPNTLAINKNTYDALPAAAKAALSKHSGESLSRAFGQSGDREVMRAITDIKSFTNKGKGELLQLSAQEEQRWRQHTSSLIDEWVKARPDGAKVLAAFQQQVSNVEAK